MLVWSGMEIAYKLAGGARPSLPSKHDTMVSKEPTPTHVQPPQRVKMKDTNFRYTT